MKSVLVVDDSASNRTVLSALLKRAGYAVRTAADAAEARRLFREESPEAVLTDLHLGEGEDGVALAAFLRRLPGGKDVRIALMSADATGATASDGAFDAVLEKPISLEVMKSFLGEAAQ